MKNLLVISLLASAALAGCAVPQSQNVPNRTEYLLEPVTGRSYYLYVSSHYNRNTPAPVIISLQGTTPYDTASGQMREWKKIAEDNGAILVCPTLKSSDGILTAGDGVLRQELLADEQLVMTILGQLHYRYNIDRRNIFLTSWSGGGFPLYFIGLRHPDVFNCIVARQSTFRRSVLEGWYPDEARRLPVLIFYGTFDLLPVVTDAKDAYAFLKGQGFREVYLSTTEGGHARHPEVAMQFFIQHWGRGPYTPSITSPPMAGLRRPWPDNDASRTP